MRDSRNMQKRATKSDTSGHCLALAAYSGGNPGKSSSVESERGYVHSIVS